MPDKRPIGRLEQEQRDLTPKEAEFLRLLGAGLSTTEAGREAFGVAYWNGHGPEIKRRAVVQGPLVARKAFLARVLVENGVDADAFAKSVKIGLEKGDAGAQRTFLQVLGLAEPEDERAKIVVLIQQISQLFAAHVDRDTLKKVQDKIAAELTGATGKMTVNDRVTAREKTNPKRQAFAS